MKGPQKGLCYNEIQQPHFCVNWISAAKNGLQNRHSTTTISSLFTFNVCLNAAVTRILKELIKNACIHGQLLAGQPIRYHVLLLSTDWD